MSAHAVRVPRRLREAALRAAATSAEGVVCGVCGQRFRDDECIEVDHITPVARGGKNELRNVRIAHGACNRAAWAAYAAWERAAQRADGALAPWCELETRHWRALVCCDTEDVVRYARDIVHGQYIGGPRPGLVGRTLRDVIAEQRHKGLFLGARVVPALRLSSVDGFPEAAPSAEPTPSAEPGDATEDAQRVG